MTTTTGISGRDAQNMVCGKTYRHWDCWFLLICLAGIPAIENFNSPILQLTTRKIESVKLPFSISMDLITLIDQIKQQIGLRYDTD